MGNILVNTNTPKTPDGDFIPTCYLNNVILVDGTSASAQSAVIDATNDRVVRIVTYATAALGGNTDAYFEIGTNPTASAATKPLPYDGFVWDGILPATYKIAAYNCKIAIYYQ